MSKCNLATLAHGGNVTISIQSLYQTKRGGIITEVTQLDDEHPHWKANIAGKEAEWFAPRTSR